MTGLVCSFVYPAQNPALMKQFEERQLTVLALDAVPRTLSRSQAYDALSSQANVAGYRAIVEAAHEFGRMFPPQMTAAGKTPQAKIMVVGGGVAGLAAVQTGKNMGAKVFCFDTRPAVEEQVKSLGGEFLKVSLNESGDGVGGYAKEMSAAYQSAQEELFRKVVPDMDIVSACPRIVARVRCCFVRRSSWCDACPLCLLPLPSPLPLRAQSPRRSSPAGRRPS
jgi:NAD/NADP transhydrogenase alpha subunit